MADEQEWRQARCGRVTASRVADIMRNGRGGAPSASRARYMGELVAERLTGVPQDNSYTSPEMQRGTDLEGEARAAYGFRTGLDIREGGMEFIAHPSIRQAGASPDTWAGEEGLAEFKCPATHTHIEYLTSEKVPADYLTQMQWQLACTGRQWCDFASYDPRLPEHLSLYVKRIERDDARISEMESEVRKFLAELEAKIAQLNGNEEAA